MGHGIPLEKVQRAERNKITHPHQVQLSTEKPHPRATRQHKIRWCGLAVVIIIEKPHRQDLQEGQQYVGVLATQSKVMQRKYQRQRLFYHGEIKSGVLLISMEPTS